MPSATFLGTTALAYTQYLDVDPDPGGTTLVAQPLGSYEIALADNWQLGVPPQDGLWNVPVPAPSVGTGFNAIPGMAVAGNTSPGYSGGSEETGDSAVLAGRLGDALTVAASVAATFLGTSSRTYTQYLDTDGAGTTLVAEPLNTYLFIAADGWNVGTIPGDGLWGAVPRGLLTFTITPGFAVIGGMSPAQPGFTSEPDVMDAMLTAPQSREAPPVARVVRGRSRKLRPAPARRSMGKRVSVGHRGFHELSRDDSPCGG